MSHLVRPVHKNTLWPCARNADSASSVRGEGRASSPKRHQCAVYVKKSHLRSTFPLPFTARARSFPHYFYKHFPQLRTIEFHKVDILRAAADNFAVHHREHAVILGKHAFRWP